MPSSTSNWASMSPFIDSEKDAKSILSLSDSAPNHLGNLSSALIKPKLRMAVFYTELSSLPIGWCPDPKSMIDNLRWANPT